MSVSSIRMKFATESHNQHMQEHKTIHVNYKTGKQDKEKILTTDYKIRELAGNWGKWPVVWLYNYSRRAFYIRLPILHLEDIAITLASKQ